MKTILVVEDEKELSGITKKYLETGGYKVICAYNGRETLHLLKNQQCNLIILDVLLPDVTGDVLCTYIRRLTPIPIIFISCLGDRELIIRALSQGGDDYMVKPVDFGELLARIDANLRRTEGNGAKRNGALRYFRRFAIDMTRHRVIWLSDNRVLDLSPTEYDLLTYMTEHENQLLTYENLYQEIWKTDSLGDTRTVMVHVSNLRKKLDCGGCEMIETVRGAGYIFNNT